jgi:uncharacterized protein (TIGR00255 family)
MICSMTGYAARDFQAEGVCLHMEIKSVNARFLDVSFRIADAFKATEMALRERISARVARGKVECRLFLSGDCRVREGELNEAALLRLGELQSRVRAALPDARPLSVSEALAWPGVWVTERAAEEGEGEGGGSPPFPQEKVLELAELALDDLVASRKREGEKLVRMILERGARIREIVERIIPMIPAAQEDFLARLRERLEAAQEKTGIETGENRLLQEVTLFAARIDVAEEITRLQAHLDELQHICATGGAIGKRLDFLMQEFNREANTLASKATLAEINQAAVELKLLIEQIREQVQNLE